MDSPSFDVIVIGAGPAGLTAATEAARAGLSALCLDKLAPGGALINLGHLHGHVRDCDGPLSDVTVVYEATVAGSASLPDGVHRIVGRIVALEGSDGLQSVVIESGGARKAIPASAVFVYVGQSPAAEFLPEMLARDAIGHIVVDDHGRTSAPTAFAVGDVRTGARQRLSDAIADGQRAGRALVMALKKN